MTSNTIDNDRTMSGSGDTLLASRYRHGPPVRAGRDGEFAKKQFGNGMLWA